MKPQLSYVHVVNASLWYLLKAVPPKLMEFLAGRSRGAIVLQINDNGEITRSLQDPTAAVIESVSSVEDNNGILYFGSYKAPFIGKLKVPALWSCDVSRHYSNSSSHYPCLLPIVFVNGFVIRYILALYVCIQIWWYRVIYGFTKTGKLICKNDMWLLYDTLYKYL